MYSLDSVKLGIADFLDKEFLSKLQSGTLEKVIMGTVLGMVVCKIDTIVPKLKENQMINFLEVIDENNNVDIDALFSVLQEQIGEEGIKVEIPLLDNNFSSVKKPITFYKTDIENLLECIKRRA